MSERPSPRHGADRLSPEAVRTLAASPVGLLGGVAYGDEAPSGADATGTPLLWPPQPLLDAWTTDTGVTTGRHGPVRWRHDGDWLYGAIEVEAPVARAGRAASLDQPAHDAYSTLFGALDATCFPHLLRLWNYLPGINAPGGGMERYRQFNSGRALAFVEAGRTLHEGAPAACALGTADGPLRLRFLAARRAPLALENPRQVSAYRYPAHHSPQSPTFSRAVLAHTGDGLALMISGTASIVGHDSLHPRDVAAQTRETIANLAALCGVACQRSGDARWTLAALHPTVYLRHAADLDAARPVVDSVGWSNPIYVQGDICRSELLVEIEAYAFSKDHDR